MPRSATPKPAAAKPATASLTAPLSFRLDDASQQALAKRAEELGISVHQMARHCVIQCLYEQEERAASEQLLGELLQESVGLRADLTNAVVALLSSAGKVEENEAQRWVNENLNQPCSPSPSP